MLISLLSVRGSLPVELSSVYLYLPEHPTIWEFRSEVMSLVFVRGLTLLSSYASHSKGARFLSFPLERGDGHRDFFCDPSLAPLCVLILSGGFVCFVVGAPSTTEILKIATSTSQSRLDAIQRIINV